MLKQEFDDRIGRVSENQEYELANRIYMCDGTSKDDFCKEWKKIDKMGIFHILVGMFKAAHHEELRQKEYIEKMTEEHTEQMSLRTLSKEMEMTDLCNQLMDANVDVMSGVIRDIVVEKIGKRDFLRYKIHNRYTIWEDEKEWLLEMI